MNKIKNTKGFTLMEMLIVVAIIAVLVAIAIPTFTTSLNDARVATDKANIRSGYASVMAEILTNQYGENGATTEAIYELQKDGSVLPKTGNTATANPYKCFGKTSAATEIAGQSVAQWGKDSTVTYKYTPEKENNGKRESVKVEIVITPKAGG